MPKSAISLTHLYMRFIPEALFFKRMTQSAVGDDIHFEDLLPLGGS